MLLEKKPKGKFGLSISVSPAESIDIAGIFITVSEIKLDDVLVKGFNKQTIDLSAYQSGDIKLLFDGEIEVGKYHSLSLVLDNSYDKNGDSPGCYLLNGKNQILPLGQETIEGEVFIPKCFEVDEKIPTELVVEFDLQKLVRNVENRQAQIPNFPDLIRAVVKDDCGFIKGSVRKPVYLPGDMYVLAYKKGDSGFKNNPGAGKDYQAVFNKALASTKVKPYGSYELALLEEGDYEIRLASVDRKSRKIYMFRGRVNPSSNVSGVLLNNIPVLAQSCVQLNIDIMGVI